MKANRLIENLTKNWPVKAASFTISLCLYIFYQMSFFDTKSFSVPLRTEAENGIVAAGTYPQNVKVSIRGKPDETSSIRENDISAYLDLNHLAKEGEYTLPVLVSFSNEALLLETLEVKVFPQNVSLKVEEMISDYVKVNSLLKGEPARGYEVKSIELDPKEILITGPRSIVENCDRLQTMTVNLNGAAVPFAQNVSLQSPGALLNIPEGTTVKVTVDVVPIIVSKTFENINVDIINADPEYNFTLSEYLVNMTFSGKMLEIEKYTSRNISVVADCSTVHSEGRFEVPLRVYKPLGLTGSTGNKSSVRIVSVKIEKEPIAESEELVDLSELTESSAQNESKSDDNLPQEAQSSSVQP